MNKCYFDKHLGLNISLVARFMHMTRILREKSLLQPFLFGHVKYSIFSVSVTRRKNIDRSLKIDPIKTVKATE